MSISFKIADGKSVSIGGQSVTWSASAVDYPTTASMDVIAMRQLTFDPSELGEVEAVEIISQPSTGRVVAMDNGKINVSLEGSGDVTGTTNFTFRATQGGGTQDCVVTVNIQKSWNARGWEDGSHYHLPEDPATNLWLPLKEEGYEDWYVSELNGYTASEIDTELALTPGTVDASYLRSNYPVWGDDPARPVDITLANAIDSQKPDQGNALTWHLERGGDYTTLNERFGNTGKSAIYPVIVTAYGTGDRPLIPPRDYTSYKYSFSVLTHLALPAGRMTTIDSSDCLAHIDLRINQPDDDGFNIQGIYGYTQRFCGVFDTWQNEPASGATDWLDFAANRSSGIFMSNVTGAYIDQNVYDRNGWNPTYLADASYNSGTNGVPPSNRSHNMYLQYSNKDVTLKENLVSRAASQGIQFRTGGYEIGNICFANPINHTNQGKLSSGEGDGQSCFSFSYRNISTQAYTHPISMAPVYGSGEYGAQETAYQGTAYQQSILYHATIHGSDPDPTHSSSFSPQRYGIIRGTLPIQQAAADNDDEYGPFYNGYTSADWLVYGWNEPDTHNVQAIASNADQVTNATIEAYTIQRYQDEYFTRTAGTTEGVDDLIAELRSLDNYRGFAKDMNDWFMNGIAAAGLSAWAIPTARTTATTVYYRPDERGLTSGKRWDEELSWSTGDYAGFVDGDIANLQGFRVNYGMPESIELDGLVLGTDGGLTAHSGSINISAAPELTTAGYIKTKMSGYVRFDGYAGSGVLTLETEGGMLANLGTITGNTDVTIGCQDFKTGRDTRLWNNTGYFLLATPGESITIGSGHTLEVTGWAVGAFDGGAGTATLTMHADSTIKFTAVDGEFGVIKEFGTGILADATAPSITSVMALNGCDIVIDATGAAAGTYDVVTLDSVTGAVGTVTGGSAAIIGGNILRITVA